MRSPIFGLLAAASAVFASSVVLSTPTSTPYNELRARDTSLVCSTPTAVPTSACSSIAGGSSTCTPTTMTISVCAAGNICQTDAAGNNVCMLKNDTLTTSGLIVTIVFSLGLVVTIGTLITLGCMASAQAKKDKREAAAKLGGKIRPMDDIDPKPYKIGGGGEGDLPLMAKSAPKNDPAHDDYFDQPGSGSNSVTPGSGPVPQIQLHQGLGALGQEEDQHWSNDYATRSR